MTDIHDALATSEELRLREKKMPKVRTTSSTMETFDSSKIIDSLVLEAGLLRADAQLVAVKVMDRIVASGIKFLSGPLIREMCNSILAEMGLENERILYTRVGIPMYDLGLLIDNPGDHTSNANLMRNPETIAKLVHDQVMEQHTYLTNPPISQMLILGVTYTSRIESISAHETIVLLGTFARFSSWASHLMAWVVCTPVQLVQLNIFRSQ